MVIKRLPRLKTAVSQFASYLAVHKFLRGFQPKIRVQFEKGNFIVKTVESWAELEQVLKLRHEVFHCEFIGTPLPFPLDFDRFDPLGDHLVIVDKEQGKIVGTYRLICSRFSENFYSASEFHLDGFLKEPGVKLELSRACIHRDYRDGVVIALLWRGLVQYIQQSQAAFLFGCASIRSMDPAEVRVIYEYLAAKQFLSNDHGIGPVDSYRMRGWDPKLVEPKETDAGKAMIPPLLNAYLRAGAKVYGQPALDEAFKCVDLFTVLKMDKLTPGFERRYQTGENPQS
ncbi:GNAT family N-acetyltransferase [bacterium]|nr:GNAT family N-acetyltransferase [bacterium]